VKAPLLWEQGQTFRALVLCLDKAGVVEVADPWTQMLVLLEEVVIVQLPLLQILAVGEDLKVMATQIPLQLV